jgi:hypothetical protein
MTPLISEFVKYIKEPETAIWFDVGILSKSDVTASPTEVLLNLPFEKTVVVAIFPDNIKFCLYMSQRDSIVTIDACHLMNGVYASVEPLSVMMRDGQLHYEASNKLPIHVSKSLISTAITCLFKINQTEAAYRASIQKSPANAKRIRKGKRPFISWHTVKIKPSEKKCEHQGGTHASPRLHDRRGHWRTYSSGKKVWVKSCKVGKASNGLVFKDYEVQPTSQTSQ